jgi:hypothetical protein
VDRLVFPERVTFRLLASNREPIRVPGVLLGVHMFAMRKNDFFLQPFPTDNDGAVAITKRLLLAEASAHYDSGLMDYAPIEESKPIVEVRALNMVEIAKAIDSRSRVWTSLLKGEAERWSSIEELIDTYKRATNQKVSVSPVRISWNAHCEEYDCALPAQIAEEF